ncbi:MAG: hypothetical protein OXF79_27685 [Chloroflexi bacterium]|nr:hypothetical protein [Chloroflexota bacterium]
MDIVPHQRFDARGNILAWLNDGTGRYAVLKSTEFEDAEAV